jgi:hypothetical protein
MSEIWDDDAKKNFSKKKTIPESSAHYKGPTNNAY